MRRAIWVGFAVPGLIILSCKAFGEADPDAVFPDAGPDVIKGVPQDGASDGGGPSDVPVEISAESDAEDDRGSGVCARYADGRVFCWGDNANGRLGVDPASTPTGFSNLAVQVTGLTEAKRISVGWRHSCAILGDDSVACWGSNSDGQLGNPGASASQFEPIAVQGIPGPVVDVAAGDTSTCAVLKNGDLYCWGFDGTSVGTSKKCSGVMGGERDGGSNIGPTHVDSPIRYQRVATAWTTVCGLTAEAPARARCWGSSEYHSLGRGPIPDDAGCEPGDVIGAGVNLAALSIGGSFHACAFGGEGVHCWGWNQFCQQGSASIGSPPPDLEEGTLVPGFEATAGVVGVSAGYGNTCAVFSDGHVACVGAGKIFAEGSSKICSPRIVPNLNDAIQVAVGNYSACAIRKSGPAGKPSVVCWGDNERGQLADGTTNPSAIPVQVNLP
jgi:hypothetical protein